MDIKKEWKTANAFACYFSFFMRLPGNRGKNLKIMACFLKNPFQIPVFGKYKRN